MTQNPTGGWFAYRMPGKSPVFGKGRIDHGFPTNIRAFAIAPFKTSSASDFLYINVEESPSEFPVKTHLPSIPTTTGIISESFGSYAGKIFRLQSWLSENNPDGKAVFSRRILIQELPVLGKSFSALCRDYPSAFVFAFGFADTKEVWLGASPELLLSRNGNIMQTMALAGTRPADSNPASEWDAKNLHEHFIVRDFIAEKLRSHGLSPEVDATKTLAAGPVEHLHTPVKSTVTEAFDVENFLLDFSPTPALCGSADRKEMAFLEELEETPREFYGGWCGPVSPDGFSLFVNLRSAKINCQNHTTCLFSGGGITLQSSASNEWDETNRKAQTLLRSLKFQNPLRNFMTIPD